MKLYDYFRSSASYRVRIALNLKKISYEKQTIHLINHGGEQRSADYLEINPQGLVPTLEEEGHILTQSLAVLEYLDERYPSPPLLPETPFERAKVRSLALAIACDIHPLNNLRVLNYLRNEFQNNEDQIKDWYHHWLYEGFEALEIKLKQLEKNKPTKFCYGETITLADVCLIPQVYNANRFGFPMARYPIIRAINDHCLEQQAFIDAKPIE